MSKPGSCIAQYTEELFIHGPIPWLALPKLLKPLPRLVKLFIKEDSDTFRAAYHPTAPCLISTMLVTSRTPLALTSLQLNRQRFSSAADVLRLLVCFPRLSTASLGDCAIKIVLATAGPLVLSACLSEISWQQYTDSVSERAIWSLVQWWRWPHAAAELAATPYPGLHPADAQEVSAIIRSIELGELGWIS